MKKQWKHVFFIETLLFLYEKQWKWSQGLITDPYPKELQSLNKKGCEKWTPKLPIVWLILGQFWGPFWVQMMRFLQIKLERCNCYSHWNYTRQKKGRDIYIYIYIAVCLQGLYSMRWRAKTRRLAFSRKIHWIREKFGKDFKRRGRRG